MHNCGLTKTAYHRKTRKTGILCCGQLHVSMDLKPRLFCSNCWPVWLYGYIESKPCGFNLEVVLTSIKPWETGKVVKKRARLQLQKAVNLRKECTTHDPTSVMTSLISSFVLTSLDQGVFQTCSTRKKH